MDLTSASRQPPSSRQGVRAASCQTCLLSLRRCTLYPPTKHLDDCAQLMRDESALTVWQSRCSPTGWVNVAPRSSHQRSDSRAIAQWYERHFRIRQRRGSSGRPTYTQVSPTPWCNGFCSAPVVKLRFVIGAEPFGTQSTHRNSIWRPRMSIIDSALKANRE
jgi:hypothetical protein